MQKKTNTDTRAEEKRLNSEIIIAHTATKTQSQTNQFK